MQGTIADLAVGLQSAKGTAVTPTERFYLTGGSVVAPDKDPVAEANVTLSQPVASLAYAPRVTAAGSPEAYVRPSMIGLLLYGILGAKAVSGSADPWTHTFSVAGTQPWLTFYRALDGTYWERFVDCKIASLTLRGSAGQPLRVAFTVAGITPRFRTADSGATVETAFPFLHYDAKAALKVEGVAVGAIDDWAITFARDTAIKDRLSGPHVRTGPRLVVTATVGQVLADMTLWNRALYGASSPANDTAGVLAPLELGGSPAGLSFKFTRQASPERSLEVDLPRVFVKAIAGPEGMANPVRQVVTYGTLKPAASSGVTAILKNARSAY